MCFEMRTLTNLAWGIKALAMVSSNWDSKLVFLLPISEALGNSESELQLPHLNIGHAENPKKEQ